MEDRDEGRGINEFELNVDNRSLGEGCQPDGITVYGGRFDRDIFPIVTRGRVKPPNENWNSLANHVQAFHTFLDYRRRYELKVEFWDVHFSQGSFKRLHTNEKNKSKKYSDAFRTFIQREDDEFAHARGNMRYLNPSRSGAPLVSLFGMCLSGALSDGAIKVIEKLATIKYPTPPTEGNPRGTLSYLPARAQWVGLQILNIQRTIVDAVTLPLKSGTAVCSANAPRQLPTDYEVEAGEAGPSGSSQLPRWESSHTPTMDVMSRSIIVNLVTVPHDRTRPLTNISGHCLETHTGSHLDVDETVSPDSTTVISTLTTANSSTAFHDSTRLPSKTSGHCLETNASLRSWFPNPYRLSSFGCYPQI